MWMHFVRTEKGRHGIYSHMAMACLLIMLACRRGCITVGCMLVSMPECFHRVRNVLGSE